MTEELKNKLTERFFAISGSEVMNKDMQDALLKAYLAGGEHGYQYSVEKACEYFMRIKECDLYEDKESQANAVDDFINRFRKAMYDMSNEQGNKRKRGTTVIQTNEKFANSVSITNGRTDVTDGTLPDGAIIMQ